VIDMVANAAFLLGLTLGLAPQMDQHQVQMTFGHGRRNFYEAARRGLDAELLWPTERTPSPQLVPARTLVAQLMPIARNGLLQAGVNRDEVDDRLALIQERVATGQTGAVWQSAVCKNLGEGIYSATARREMLLRYLERSLTEQPVHRWQL
jgi:hypothetical protein